jgi:uncharacterized protein (TIGR00299 family) protein
MTSAYFDCFSGISGDMTLGALVGLGVPVEWMQTELERLPLDEFSLDCNGVDRHGIHAHLMEIRFEESHHHRHYQTIAEMIGESPFSSRVKETSLAMFDRVAAAEAAVHQMPKEKVHFHEVGAMDAIIDIVGTCLGLEYLDIDRVTASPLPLGSGFVQCLHGTLPVPAPATLEILKGLPVHAGNIAKEMVTPTGAAIISTIADAFETLPLMRVERVAYGAGTRELGDQPNLLRVILGQAETGTQGRHSEKQVMVECNIDDMNPEWFGYLMETLFDDGALDVFWEPIYMKKNRPGTLVRVLCGPDKRQAVVDRILTETTTIGVRFYEVQRSCLKRRAVEVETPWGRIAAKAVSGADGNERVVPEFDACKKVAQAHGVALRTVYEAVADGVKKAGVH